MDDLNVVLKLERIKCHDEGDGSGSAEPYLWTVFFKADGETLVVNTQSLSVEGAPVVVGTPGNRGNLGTGAGDVDEGDEIIIPALIGEYRTVMKPIPLTAPLGTVTEAGGVVGCIVVLMEEDRSSTTSIVRAHEALDREVRGKLGEAIASLTIVNPELSDEAVDTMAEQIDAAVHSAASDGQSVLGWLANFGNMDDTIGSGVFRFTHARLEAANGAPIPFSKRWDNEGDWELFGSITATAIRRQDPKCCQELKQTVKELQIALDAQGKRIDGMERRLSSRGSSAEPTSR